MLKSEWVEWDAFPDPPKRQRRRRPPPILDGEILEPELEPETPRIHRVEIVHHHHRRQRQHIPTWAVAILIIGFLCWVWVKCVEKKNGG